MWTEQTAPAPPGGQAAGVQGSGLQNTMDSVGNQVSAAVASVNDQQMAMFAHFGQLLGLVSGIGGFLVPLIILLTKGKESPFVRRAAAESLNFWITGILASIVAFILIFVLVGIFLFFLVAIVWLVMPIYAGIKANDGVDYRYPFNIRIVR